MSQRPATISLQSPFARLRNLLEAHAPGQPALSLALGEPRHAAPEFVLQALAADPQSYTRYPPIAGLPQWRDAVAGWLHRRFDIAPDTLSQAPQILPLNGTREGLFMAAQLAPPKDHGLMAMPNPFYQVYASAVQAAGATPLYMDATAATGFLPDLDSLDDATLSRLRALYLCTPANPQGAIADLAYLEKAYAMARQHNFLLLVDECYAEIYDRDYEATPPPSILQVLQKHQHHDAPVISFHSLSKRSNLPGLRSGFCAGGEDVMKAFFDLRMIAGPQSPIAVQTAAALAWGEDTHVAENRALYQQKFDVAATLFADWPGFFRPPGGFFLWLRVEDGEAAALALWRQVGIQVLPGAYLTRPSADGTNIGTPYIRVALVGDLDETHRALSDIARVLSPPEEAVS
ncbi:aminotransferase class I/II-fold pyridoxal phosphate-dependent enzyme [Alphaproteobacteria bacterium]|nr:aminotransferase class I/II-fold pyridoxal phosphate-dependent enzyme [Alphaproteobacteria bacterium]